ncbi:AraC family transcriptional regulator [Ideonella sp. A 288]|uniref:AraC family transcriptional regulator n=1 Tax=Ideonella sp. A 288 TaxID=1962181 RepID=UPI000B4ACCB7|nr:AraC family transcriptional regulator [Ideonella sp. A 288]
MAVPAHTVSIAFVRSAVRALAPQVRARVLCQAGIADEALRGPDARVPATAFGALWMAVARELDDEFFGLDRRRMKVGSFVLLCHAVAAQPTVERALRMALRGFALGLDDMAATLVAGGREARVEIDNRIGDRPGPGVLDPAGRADARRFADETLLVMVHGLLCWVAGRRVPLLRLDWAHPQPAHADEYRRMFSADVRFDRPATAIAFDAGVLQAPVSVSEASLKAFLRDAPQSVFLKQVASGGWAERARRHLRRALSPGAAPLGAEGPTLDQLAARLGVSAATLRRRLDGEGTHWQQLKDEVRRDLAIQHLADRRISVEQVAAWLGFNDGPSFHRAFRKWTGSAPGAYRSGRPGRAAPGP